MKKIQFRTVGCIITLVMGMASQSVFADSFIDGSAVTALENFRLGQSLGISVDAEAETTQEITMSYDSFVDAYAVGQLENLQFENSTVSDTPIETIKTVTIKAGDMGDESDYLAINTNATMQGDAFVNTSVIEACKKF